VRRILRRPYTRRALLLGGASAAAILPWELAQRTWRGADARTIEHRTHEIGERYGLRIGYGLPQTFYVPPYTAEDAQSPSWTLKPAHLTDLPDTLDGIEAALSQYPRGFVSGLCRAIFLCGELLLEGVSVSATYGPAWIVIRAESGLFSSYNAEGAQLALHHELASFLWNANPMLQIIWSALLPAGWQPKSKVSEMVEASHRGDDRVAEGFLRPYGATTDSNDFSTYAEAVFMEPERVAQLAALHPVIGHKAGLLLRTYAGRDPRMGAVFQERGLAHLQAAEPPTIEIDMGSSVVIPQGKVIR
jgi:hypothetical protein